MTTSTIRAVPAAYVAAPPDGDGVTTGPPLSVLGDLPRVERIEDMLRRSAERVPERPALVSSTAKMTFADLQADVLRCATALHALAEGRPVVVAIASVLDPAFAVAYFGAARAGLVTALINPLLPAARLRFLLAASEAEIAIVPPSMLERLTQVRDQLPRLRRLVLTSPDPQARANETTLATLLDRYEGLAPPVAPVGGDTVANLQFTSGTTGDPKTVQLTHRNLVVNAAQSAWAHRLGDDAVLLNNLPTFHLMHLNVAACVGATEVLCPADDGAVTVAAAARHGVTHLYSLPVRLTRLSRLPGLAQLAAPALRAILSGGSAPPSTVTHQLSAHFGVPVMQGYGLAETAPSTHFDIAESPRPGSCGPPVPGTQCRIVDVESRRVFPAGDRGEIQVRGPQLMLGYQGHEAGADVDDEGWFSTGDIGRLDEDGYLSVVDRAKDVFKCDNWLVSPMEIERALQRHPAVQDCVVFDHPDELSGGVAYALAVLMPDAKPPEEIAAEVNAALPYYEHVHLLVPVADIARSATGKIPRRELRDRFERGEIAASAPER